MKRLIKVNDLLTRTYSFRAFDKEHGFKKEDASTQTDAFEEKTVNLDEIRKIEEVER